MSILSIFSTWFILVHSVVVLVHCSFLTYNMLPFVQNYSLTTVSVTANNNNSQFPDNIPQINECLILVWLYPFNG